MEDTRLILLEGLPGTGKSTSSYFLRLQLERNGKSVDWIHEVAEPHPTSFVEGRALPIKQYQTAALDRWTCFVEEALREKDIIYILDSSMLQFQIFTFLLKNATYEELWKFLQELVAIVKPLNPNLIYLYRENTEDSIRFLQKNRGTKFLRKTWERDKAEPYYHDKPEGAKGFQLFLRDYANMANRLFSSIDCRKTDIEITEQDWVSYRQSMLSFLKMAQNGVLENDLLGLKIKIDRYIIEQRKEKNI